MGRTIVVPYGELSTHPARRRNSNGRRNRVTMDVVLVASGRCPHLHCWVWNPGLPGDSHLSGESTGSRACRLGVGANRVHEGRRPCWPGILPHLRPHAVRLRLRPRCLSRTGFHRRLPASIGSGTAARARRHGGSGRAGAPRSASKPLRSRHRGFDLDRRASGGLQCPAPAL